MNLSHVRYFGFKNKGTGTDAAEHMYKILQQQSCQQSSRFLHFFWHLFHGRRHSSSACRASNVGFSWSTMAHWPQGNGQQDSGPGAPSPSAGRHCQQTGPEICGRCFGSSMPRAAAFPPSRDLAKGHGEAQGDTTPRAGAWKTAAVDLWLHCLQVAIRCCRHGIHPSPWNIEPWREWRGARTSRQSRWWCCRRRWHRRRPGHTSKASQAEPSCMMPKCWDTQSPDFLDSAVAAVRTAFGLHRPPKLRLRQNIMPASLSFFGIPISFLNSVRTCPSQFTFDVFPRTNLPFVISDVHRCNIAHGSSFVSASEHMAQQITASELVPILIHSRVDIPVYTLSGSLQVIVSPYGYPQRISEKIAREGGSERLRVMTLNFRWQKWELWKRGTRTLPGIISFKTVYSRIQQRKRLGLNLRLTETEQSTSFIIMSQFMSQNMNVNRWELIIIPSLRPVRDHRTWTVFSSLLTTRLRFL